MGYASQLMGLAQAAARDAFGESVTYTPQSGSAVTCEGRYRREAVTILDSSGAPVDTWREVVQLIEDDLGGPVPRTGDTLAVGDGTYKVVGVDRGPRGVVTVTIGRRQ